jgi:hypothetical protein
MRIAVCYFGNTGGKTGSFGKGGYLDPEYPLIRNHNTLSGKKYQIDYFVHCWNNEFKKKILKLLKPKKYKFENYSKVKLKNYADYGLKNFLIYKQYLEQHYKELIDKLLIASQCRIYSQSFSLKMMIKFMKINKIKYDWILITRMDQIFLYPIKFEKLDTKFTYLPFNTKKRFGYEDYFALSSIKDAKKISNWFLCRNKYALTTPDSIRQHFDKFNVQIKPFLRVGKDFLLYRNIFFSKKMRIFRFVNYLKSFFKNNK